jgi:hypothetical protein
MLYNYSLLYTTQLLSWTLQPVQNPIIPFALEENVKLRF